MDITIRDLAKMYGVTLDAAMQSLENNGINVLSPDVPIYDSRKWTRYSQIISKIKTGATRSNGTTSSSNRVTGQNSQKEWNTTPYPSGDSRSGKETTQNGKSPNFMDRMRAEHSPEGIRKKENEKKQNIDNKIRYLAGRIYQEIERHISRAWDKHHLEGYIESVCVEGDYYVDISEQLDRRLKIDSCHDSPTSYIKYLQIKDEYEADIFTKFIRESMVKDGVNDFTIRKEKVEVESRDGMSLLRMKKKEYDAYIFYITVNW